MMGKILLAAGILAVIAACVVLLVPSEDSQSTAPFIENAIAALQQEQNATKSSEPKPKSLTGLPVPSETGPWPKVVAEEVSFAFGRMHVKEHRTHVFSIGNSGEADLQLKTGNTTCKCTTFALGKELLKPGETTTLTMDWKSGDVPDNSFRHGGDVYTNDPKRKLINFAVEGAIELSYETMPFTWSFGSVSADQTGRFKGMILTRIFEGFEIKSIECRSGKITANAVPLTPEEKAADQVLSGFAIHLELAADVPTGTFEDELAVHVTFQEEPILIPVRARKHGLIRLQQIGGTIFNPEKMLLSLGSFSAAAGRSAKLMVIIDEKDMAEGFRIAETTSDPPGLKAELEPLGNPTGTIHRYTLTLTVPPGRPRVQKTDTSPGIVTLKTNHPNGETVEISVQMNSR
jgi:Protein of unknown function (DUF1573)